MKDEQVILLGDLGFSSWLLFQTDRDDFYACCRLCFWCDFGGGGGGGSVETPVHNNIMYAQNQATVNTIVLALRYREIAAASWLAG